MNSYEQTYCAYNILHSEPEFVAVDVINDICLSKVDLPEQERPLPQI